MSKRKNVVYYPIIVPIVRNRFNLFQTLCSALKKNEVEIQDGDIIVFSSKFVSLSEGRVLDLDKIQPSKKALEIASKLNMSSSLTEIVIREADTIFSGIVGFLLTIKEGVVVPNAGIDKSNIDDGKVILYPQDPFVSADRIRMQILFELEKKVGVIISDSRLMPTRIGTIGITLAVSGFQPVSDERGKKDLFGNIICVTKRAISDEISAGANFLMGETDERTPIVIVRDTDLKMVDQKFGKNHLSIDEDECIFVRGLNLKPIN